jgi:hypothetical protein
MPTIAKSYVVKSYVVKTIVMTIVMTTEEFGFPDIGNRASWELAVTGLRATGNIVKLWRFLQATM